MTSFKLRGDCIQDKIKSDDIYKLVNLKKLTLKYFTNNKNINSNGICNLINLTSLNVNYSKYMKSSDICNLINLTSLDISNNTHKNMKLSEQKNKKID